MGSRVASKSRFNSMTTMITRVIFTGIDHDPTWVFDKISEEPELHDDHMFLRIRLATICGSDMHTILGKRPASTPMVLGHEAVGEIEIDKRANPLPKGTRVTFSIVSSCFDCERCRLGMPQKCIHLEKVGHTSLAVKQGLNGCYASHIILGPGHHVVPIPDVLSDRVAAPINCALATVMHAAEKARTGVLDKSVLVFGAGLLGIYTCAVMKEQGYEKVWCSDMDGNRLKIAEKFGAATIHAQRFMEDDCSIKEVDAVIEVCGNAQVIQHGFRRLRHGGILILVGLVHPDSDLGLTGEQIISKGVTIKGIHNYTPKHLDDALEFLIRTIERYPYDELISPHAYPLQHIERALNETKKQLYHRSCLDPWI